MHWKQNSSKIETTGSLRAYDTIFMNVGEFVERREAVKELTAMGRQASKSPHFSHRVSSTHTCNCEYSHTRSRVLAHVDARGFLVNISKFANQREVIKDQLGVDKLLTSCIFAVQSQILLICASNVYTVAVIVIKASMTLYPSTITRNSEPTHFQYGQGNLVYLKLPFYALLIVH